MTSWYFPINDDQFLFVKALNDGDKESVDIRDSYSFALGDRVYVYRPFPDNCIKYEMEVVLTGIRFEESADKVDFWRDPESYYNGLMTTPYCRLKIVRKIDNPELTATNLKAHGLRNIFSVDVLPETQFKNVGIQPDPLLPSYYLIRQVFLCIFLEFSA